MKKLYLIVPGLIAALSGAAIIGGSSVFAQTDMNRQSFVQELAQKLGIEESKVQDAVNQIHDDRKANWQTSFEDRLQKLVDAGKLTADQKQKIVDKENELQSQLQDIKNQNLSMADKRTKMKEIFDNLTQWAKDNNIDPKLVGHTLPGRGMRKGFRMGYMMDKNS